MAHQVLLTVAIAVVYVLTARIGQAVALPPGNVTPVWLPSGIMFALAVHYGLRVAPGVFLGAFVGNAWAYFSTGSLEVSLRAIAAGTSNGVGDVLATVALARLLVAWRGTDQWFDHLDDVVAFVGIGAVGGGLVSAVFGVGALVGLGFVPMDAASVTFITWWTGDGVGVLLFAPMLLAWRRRSWSSWPLRRRRMAHVVGVGAWVVPGLGFGLLPVPDVVVMAMVVVSPMLLWLALDLGRRVAFTALAQVGAVAITATGLGRGPFQGLGPSLMLPNSTHASLVSLQLFLAGISASILLLSVLAAQRSRARSELLEANERLESLSRTDVLTGLPNRLHIRTVLEGAVERLQRFEEPTSILLVDIDHFKRVNDEYGHNVGDVVLQAVARALREGVRGVDTAGRWGGEEFLVVLERCAIEDAYVVAEQLRKRVAGLEHPGIRRITVSIGIAPVVRGDRVESVVERADVALYAAKTAGRNRVEVAAGR